MDETAGAAFFVIVNYIYKEYAAAIKRPHVVYQNLSVSM